MKISALYFLMTFLLATGQDALAGRWFFGSGKNVRASYLKEDKQFSQRLFSGISSLERSQTSFQFPDCVIRLKQSFPNNTESVEKLDEMLEGFELVKQRAKSIQKELITHKKCRLARGCSYFGISLDFKDLRLSDSHSLNEKISYNPELFNPATETNAFLHFFTHSVKKAKKTGRSVPQGLENLFQQAEELRSWLYEQNVQLLSMIKPFQSRPSSMIETSGQQGSSQQQVAVASPTLHSTVSLIRSSDGENFGSAGRQESPQVPPRTRPSSVAFAPIPVPRPGSVRADSPLDSLDKTGEAGVPLRPLVPPRTRPSSVAIDNAEPPAPRLPIHGGAVPPPPPPPPPPSMGWNASSAVPAPRVAERPVIAPPRDSLLESIKDGTNLKHVDTRGKNPEAGDARSQLMDDIRAGGSKLKHVEKNQQAKPAISQATGFQAALIRALDSRRNAIEPPEESADGEDWQ